MPGFDKVTTVTLSRSQAAAACQSQTRKERTLCVST
jgi:hypothetical protein